MSRTSSRTPLSFQIGLLLLVAASTHLIAGCGSGMPSAGIPDSLEGDGLLCDVTDDGVKHVTTKLSDAIGQTDKTVVIDFWAPWCGPCRMISAELDAVAAELEESHVIVKINIDEHPELAEHFQVNAIPDVRVFRDGKYVDGFRGYQEAERILAVVR